MPNSYTNLANHIIFGTKARRPLIDPDKADDLYAYIAGAIKTHGGTPVIISGTQDHIHILTKLRPDVRLSDLLREIKSQSTKWLNSKSLNQQFSWQEGYGAFSVSRSQIDNVTTYIKNQKQHHQQTSFEEEFEALLVAHGIDFESKYLWRSHAVDTKL